MGWLSRLFGAREPAGVPAPPPAAEPSTQTSDAGDPGLSEASGTGLLLASLLGGAPPVDKEPTPDEKRFVAALDEVLAQGQVADSLLPRAAAFVPQLLALLRQSDATLADIAARIAQDAPLAAEVLRAASSAARGGGEVQDLAQAVQRVGSTGVQQAVARVVFRPMYGGSGGSLGVRAGPWLWLFSERFAEAATLQARAAGLPAFDGYLAGLLHSTGWMVALRIADKAGIPVELPQSLAVAAAVEARAHRLFGLAAQRWEITPGFTLFAKDAAETPWARSSLPLAHVLRQTQAAVLAGPAS